MQALDLYGPVQCLEVLIKRGKGERLISIAAESARLTFVPNTLGIASTDDAQPDCSFARWHEPDLHDFIAVLTGHLPSCY